MHRAFDDGQAQVAHGVHAAEGAEFVPGVVEVEEHHDAGLGVEARERNEADPHRGA